MASWWNDEGAGFEGNAPPAPPAPFHGRKREIAAFTAALGPGARLAVHPLDGEGTGEGAGSSALVWEALRREGVSVLAWARELEGPRMERAASGWAEQVGAEVAPDAPFADVLAAVAARIDERTTVVLDGVTVADRAAVEAVRAALPSQVALVLVASSSAAVPEDFDRLELPPLVASDAIAILHEELGRVPQNKAVALIEACGRMPLALRLVGRRGRLQPTDDALTLLDLPVRDDVELALAGRLEGNRAAVNAFLALLVGLNERARRTLRAAALAAPATVEAGRLADVLRVNPHEVEADLRDAVDASLAIPRGAGRYALHAAVRSWLVSVASGLGEAADVRRSSMIQAHDALTRGRPRWNDLLVAFSAMQDAEAASNREALLGWFEVLVLGPAWLVRSGMSESARRFAASALRLPGAQGARLAAVERWLRDQDPDAVITPAPAPAPARPIGAEVETLRLELVEIAGEASITAAESAAQAAVFVETGRQDASGVDDPRVRAALHELSELGAQSDAASEEAQAAVEELLIATTAARIEEAAQRAVEAQQAAERLAAQAEQAWDALRKEISAARAGRVRRDAMRARLREAVAGVDRLLDEAREQVRALRAELPDALSGVVAEAWAVVPKGLSDAMDAQRGLHDGADDDDEGALARLLQSTRTARGRAEAGAASAVSAAMEAVRLARLAGEQQAALHAARELERRGRDAAERFRATSARVNELLGVASDAESDALRASMDALRQRMDDAMNELVRTSRAETSVPVETGGRVRLAQRAQQVVSQASVDALALVDRADALGARSRAMEATRAIDAARVRARRELASIDQRLAELEPQIAAARDIARAHPGSALREPMEDLAGAWAGFAAAADAARAALREVERAATGGSAAELSVDQAAAARPATDAALEVALRHTASLRDPDARVVEGLAKVGVASKAMQDAELEALRQQVARRRREADEGVGRIEEMREEAATLLATIDVPGLAGLLQRLGGVWDRAAYAREQLREADARVQAARLGAERPDALADASRAAGAAESATRSLGEAFGDAEAVLVRCREVHALWVEERRRAEDLVLDLRNRVEGCGEQRRRAAEAVEETRRLVADVESAEVRALLQTAEDELAAAELAIDAARSAVQRLDATGEEAQLAQGLSAAGAAFKGVDEAIEGAFEALTGARQAYADAVAARVRRAELLSRLDVLVEESDAVVASAERRVADAQAAAASWPACADDLRVAQGQVDAATAGRAALLAKKDEVAVAAPGRLSELGALAEDLAEELVASAERAREAADRALEAVEEAAEELRRHQEEQRQAALLRLHGALELWLVWRDDHETLTADWIEAHGVNRPYGGPPVEDEVAAWRSGLVELAARVDEASTGDVPEREPLAWVEVLEALVEDRARVESAWESVRVAVAAWESAQLAALAERSLAGRAAVAAAVDDLCEIAISGVQTGEIDALLASDAEMRGREEGRIGGGIAVGLAAWLRELAGLDGPWDPEAAVEAVEGLLAEIAVRVEKAAADLVAESRLQLGERRARLEDEGAGVAARAAEVAAMAAQADALDDAEVLRVLAALDAWSTTAQANEAAVSAAMARAAEANGLVALERCRSDLRALGDAIEASASAFEGLKAELSAAVERRDAERRTRFLAAGEAARTEARGRLDELVRAQQMASMDAQGLDDASEVASLVGLIYGDLSAAERLVEGFEPLDPSATPSALWEQLLADAGRLGAVLGRGLRLDRRTNELQDVLADQVARRVDSARRRVDGAVSVALDAEGEVTERVSRARSVAANWPGDDGVVAALSEVVATSRSVYSAAARVYDASTQVVRTASVVQAEQIASDAEATVRGLAAGIERLDGALATLQGAVRDAVAEEIEAVRARAGEVEVQVGREVVRVAGRLAEAEAQVEGWTLAIVDLAVAEVVARAGAVERLAGRAERAGDGAAAADDALSIGSALEDVRQVEVDLVEASAAVDDAVDALAALLAAHLPDQIAQYADDAGVLVHEAEESGLRAEFALSLGEARAEKAETVAGPLAALRASSSRTKAALDALAAGAQAVSEAPTVAEAIRLLAELRPWVQEAITGAAEAEQAHEALEEGVRQEEALAALRGGEERRLRGRLADLQVTVDEVELSYEATRNEFEATAPAELADRWRSMQVGVWQLSQELGRLQGLTDRLRTASSPELVTGLVSEVEAVLERRFQEGRALQVELESAVDSHLRYTQDQRDQLEGRIELRRAVASSQGLEASVRAAVARAVSATAVDPSLRSDLRRCLDAAVIVTAEAAAIAELAQTADAADGAVMRAAAQQARSRSGVLRDAAREALTLAGRSELVAEHVASSSRAEQDASSRALRSRALEAMRSLAVVPALRTRVRGALRWPEVWDEPGVALAAAELSEVWEAAEAAAPRVAEHAGAALRSAAVASTGAYTVAAEEAAERLRTALDGVRAGVDALRAAVRLARDGRVRAQDLVLQHRKMAGEVAAGLQGADGGIERRMALFERGLEMARRRGDPDDLRGWLTDLADLRVEAGRPSDALPLLQQALPLAAARSARAEAQVLARFARVARLSSDGSAADVSRLVALCERALRAADRAGAPALAVGVEVDLALLFAARGERDEARAALGRARSAAARDGDRRVLAVLELREAQVERALGEPGVALAAAHRAQDSLAAAFDPRAAAGAAVLVSALSSQLGDAGGAAIAAGDAASLAAAEAPDAVAAVEMAGAVALLQAGRGVRARAEAERVARAPGAPRELLDLARRVGASAVTRIGLGDVAITPALALAAAKDVRRRSRRGGSLGLGSLGGAQPSALRRAAKAWEELSQQAVRRKDPLAASDALARAAVAWRAAGDPAEARLAAEAARRLIPAGGDELGVARVVALLEHVGA